ncbi:hypothetical protein M569_00674, partial [Genlisea aurea]
VLFSTCAPTLYPELCVSTVGSSPAVETAEDVMMKTLNQTVLAVERNYCTLKRTAAGKSGILTVRGRNALGDCVELNEVSMEELGRCGELMAEHGMRIFSDSGHVETILTLLSAVQTNQMTCLDGLSGDENVRRLLSAGHNRVFRLASNLLAMTRNLSNAELPRIEQRVSRWPGWLSQADRMLLQAPSVTADVTVAADGSGNYRTISEAVSAAPSNSKTRFVIRIKAGTYKEYVTIPASKQNLMFVGDSYTTTIVTGDRNYIDGSTTFNSATVAVVGTGFLARDITFQNTAGAAKHQAVALRVNADLTAFYRCGIYAYQDTLYTHSLRQFYTNCYISGTVDFIFGNSAVVIQESDIRARVPLANQKNMVTAQGREDPNQNTGIVIQRSTIDGTSDLLPVIKNFPTYLGRPWKQYSRTVIMQTTISAVIRPEGWYPWEGDFALSTLFYAEYANTGPGASTANRVNWVGFTVFTSSSQAKPYTAENFIGANSWLPATGFPFNAGL